jgi:hypothetical protein
VSKAQQAITQQGGAPTSIEASVRQLIANGKSRTALENAKEFYKSQRSEASEVLLLDAYAARIQSLLDQNLATEAKALIDLLGERFPAAKARLAALKGSASAQDGDLAALLQPLNDPELSFDLRAAIEKTVETRITDLAALAGCASLPAEHRFRQAAAALDQAFNLVTSGPVTAEQIALPEVSHRSPLAPWKLLIRAIACFHRGDDAECRECLAAINPEAAAARLVPVIRAMLGDQPAAALKPAETALIAHTNVNLSEFRKALENLDRAFSEHSGDGRIFKAIRTAVAECQRGGADQLPLLKQLIAVRGGVAALDHERLMTAMNGAPRRDAAFFRMYACALERTSDADDLGEACEAWEEFRREAVREGWFAANGLEAAVLYLHIANLLEKMPPDLLGEFQRPRGAGRNTEGVESRYFLFPEKLYARACAIDPTAEGFSQWLRWASGRGVYESKGIAEEWHRLRKNDIEPVLYLMEGAEKRNAFPTALSWLEKAERIDPVHSVVRAARLRILAAGAMRHLRQKKPHLAAEKLAAMEALPQARQGNRPAFLAALRSLILKESGDSVGAESARIEAARLLGGDLAARFVVFAMASVSRRFGALSLPLVKGLGKAEKSEIPAALAKMVMVCEDMGIDEYGLPIGYFGEAEVQFPRVAGSLDIEQLRSLGNIAVAADRAKLAWAASTEGLKRGGTLEAHFMLLRARAMPARHGQRYLAVAAAAAELGRLHGNSDVVGKAIEIVRNPLGGDSISLTQEQARDVVRKEIASPKFPGSASRDPDYSDLMPRRELCQCPDCRAARGEITDPFDDDESFDDFEKTELEEMFNESIPDDIPPEVSKTLLGILKEALSTGESPEKIMARVLGGGPPGKRKKGRRK